jgi:integrase
MEFALWLSTTSFGYLPAAYDHDRIVTSRRKLEFDQYIRIIQELSDRERILSKLFYLGGSRTLEEVLSLKIEDINFKECTLRLSEEIVSYPKHVFNDLKTYIGSRKKGPVFIGRNGEKVDHTVPYRALKTVAANLNLDSAFSFKDFVSNV